jgi:type VII secretion protein EccE
MPEVIAGARTAGRFGAAQLVAVELAAVAGAGAALATPPFSAGLAGAAAVLAGGALVRSGGRWGYEAAAARLRYQRRQLFGEGGPALLASDLRISGFTDRGASVGIGKDARGWYAAITIGVPHGRVSIRLDWLARTLADSTVPVSTLQLVTRQTPLSAPPDERSDSALSYRELLGSGQIAINQEMWLAVRLGPADAAHAAAERGGGVEGVHRALAAAVARLSTALNGADLPHAVLDAAGLQRVLLLSCGLVRPGAVEQWTRWQAAGLDHVGFAVSGWPREARPGLLSELAKVPSAPLVQTAMVLRRKHTGPPALRVLLRVAAPPERIVACTRQLHEMAVRLGVKLVRLNGEHAAAVYATAPTGAVHGVALW